MEAEPDHVCQVCGLPIAVGQWPCVVTIRPHGRSVQTNVFIAYEDFALGETVTSIPQRARLMQQKGLVDRPKWTAGDVSAHRDKSHERRKEDARG
jgi:hypothetical protein